MKKLFLPALALLLLALPACRRDRLPNGWTNDPPALNEARVFVNNQQPIAQSFTLDASMPGVINTNKGIRFAFPAGCFRQANGNSLASGSVRVSVTEYFTNRDFVTGNGMSTATRDGDLLLSSGAFQISASLAGSMLGQDSLSLAHPVAVSIPANGAILSSNRIYIREQVTGAAARQDNNRVVWAPAPIEWFRGPGVNGSYDFELPTLGWCNLDRLADLGNGKSPLQVQLPDGCGNDNCIVVLLLPGNGATHLWGDPQTQRFTTGPYAVPVGMQVNILTIQSQDGQLKYSLQPHTVQAGNKTVVVSTLQDISSRDLRAVIENSL